MENLEIRKSETYADKLEKNKRRESHRDLNQNIEQELDMQVFAEEDSELASEEGKQIGAGKEPQGESRLDLASQLAEDA